MNTLQKFILGIVSIAIIFIGIHAYSSNKLGDATVSNYPTWYYNGIVIGKDNSLVSNIDWGQCSLIGQASLANGNSEVVTCTASNVAVGDKVEVQLVSAGTTPTTGGFPIVDATVSSAGVITMHLVNNSGSTQTPAVGPINYIDFR